MKFLLFLVGISYFFIFFFLNRSGEESLMVPLFIQAQIYVVIALIFILYTVEMKKFKKKETHMLSGFQFQPSLTSSYLKRLLKENLYFFGIILFYISIFFISRGLFQDIYLSHIFALVNIGVIFLYFFITRSQLLYDIVRGNTIITSLFYSLSHILFLFGFISSEFLLSDYINMGAVSILFIALFSSERSKMNASIFASHALIFFLLEISILFYFIIPSEFFIISIIYILSMVIHIFFYGVDVLVKKTYIPKEFFIQIGFFLSLVLVSLGVIPLMGDFSFLFLLTSLLIFLHASYLILYYKYFGNIWSLFFGFFGFVLFFSACIIALYGREFLLYNGSFLLLGVSLLFVLLPLIKKYITQSDVYIIHLFFLGVNILGVLLFLIFREFSILYFGFLLLFEAGYFISNSYLFKKIYRGKQV